MGKCNEYEISIPKGSPVRGLYDDLKKNYGVTDADFDRGRHIINYSSPGQMPLLDSDPDCEVIPEEVVELSLDDWQKYREALKKAFGLNALFWDVQDGKAMPEISRQVTSLAQKAFDELGRILTEKGLQKDSAEYIISMATGIRLFAAFPTAAMLNSFSALQREAASKGLEEEVRARGLDAFLTFLSENGGLGAGLAVRNIPVDYNATVLEKLKWGGGSSFEMLLFGLYEMAGLKTRFVESMPALQEGGSLVMPMLTFTLYLGVDIGGKLFFPSEEGLKDHYPVDLRHVLIQLMFFSGVERRSLSAVKTEDFKAARGVDRMFDLGTDIASTSCFIMQQTAMEGGYAGDDLITDMAERVLDDENAGDVCSYAAMLVFIKNEKFRKVKELCKRLANSQSSDVRGIAHIFDVMTGLLLSGKKKKKALIDRVEKESAEYPDDLGLKAILGFAYADDGRTEEAKRILLEVTDKSPGTGDAQYYLGRIFFREANYEKAVEHLTKAFGSVSSNVIGELYLLGYSYWMLGDQGSAREVWQMIVDQLSDIGNVAKHGEAAVRNVKEGLGSHIKNDPLSREALDSGAGEMFALIYLKMGSILFFLNKLSEARKTFEEGLAFVTEGELRGQLEEQLSMLAYIHGGEDD